MLFLKPLIAAVVAAAAFPALAQDAVQVPRAMTVAEVINMGDALRALGDHPEIDQMGRPTGKIASTNFKFGGDTLMSMALNIEASDRQRAAYKSVYNKLVMQFSDDHPPVAPDKLQEFNVEAEKAQSSFSKEMLYHIPQAALCLQATPEGRPVPPCTTVNAIPPAVLATLLPIIDR